MKKYKLYTSVKCEVCIDKINTQFSRFPEIIDFKVDLKDPKRTLSVTVADTFSERKVKEALKEIGYYAVTPTKNFWQKLFGI